MGFCENFCGFLKWLWYNGGMDEGQKNIVGAGVKNGAASNRGFSDVLTPQGGGGLSRNPQGFAQGAISSGNDIVLPATEKKRRWPIAVAVILCLVAIVAGVGAVAVNLGGGDVPASERWQTYMDYINDGDAIAEAFYGGDAAYLDEMKRRFDDFYDAYKKNETEEMAEVMQEYAELVNFTVRLGKVGVLDQDENTVNYETTAWKDFAESSEAAGEYVELRKSLAESSQNYLAAVNGMGCLKNGKADMDCVLSKTPTVAMTTQLDEMVKFTNEIQMIEQSAVNNIVQTGLDIQNLMVEVENEE